MKGIVLSEKAHNAEEIKKKNKLYEFFSFGEGRYARKLQTSEQQTIEFIKTSQYSFCPRKPTKNNSTWVTVWKIYDEYFTSTDEKDKKLEKILYILLITSSIFCLSIKNSKNYVLYV